MFASLQRNSTVCNVVSLYEGMLCTFSLLLAEVKATMQLAGISALPEQHTGSCSSGMQHMHVTMKWKQ